MGIFRILFRSVPGIFNSFMLRRRIRRHEIQSHTTDRDDRLSALARRGELPLSRGPYRLVLESWMHGYGFDITNHSPLVDYQFEHCCRVNVQI